MSDPHYWGFCRSRSGEIFGDTAERTILAPVESATAARDAAAMLGSDFVLWEGPDGQRVRRNAKGRKLGAWKEDA